MAKVINIVGYGSNVGKTLLMEKIIKEVDAKKYFFITNIDEFYNENVYHYNVFGLFYESKQIKRLPIKDEKGRKLYGLILDEINLKYNRRLNRSKDYNNSFVGLIELLVTHRHQKIPRVYFIGQKRRVNRRFYFLFSKFLRNKSRTAAFLKFLALKNSLIISGFTYISELFLLKCCNNNCCSCFFWSKDVCIFIICVTFRYI